MTPPPTVKGLTATGRGSRPLGGQTMIRYSLFLISAVLAITTAASAQLTYTPSARPQQQQYRNQYLNQQYRNQEYYNQQYYNQRFDNGQYQGQPYSSGRGHYRDQNDGLRNQNRGNNGSYRGESGRRTRNAGRRGMGRNASYQNQTPPPGHYYCQTHNEFCSH